MSCRNKACEHYRGKPQRKVKSAEVHPAPRRGRQDEVSLTFSGDDAVVIRRFVDLSLEKQGNPAEDLAALIELFMDGRMVVT